MNTNIPIATESIDDEEDNLEMVLIPPGEFLMRSDIRIAIGNSATGIEKLPLTVRLR